MIRTGEEYRASLRDGREVWMSGERVHDVTTHRQFRPLVDARARIYDMAHEDATRDVVSAGRRGRVPGRAITVTGSKRAMASTAAAYSASASASRPPHSSERHGQETNVPSCSAVLLGTNSESSRGLGTMASWHPDGGGGP